MQGMQSNAVPGSHFTKALNTMHERSHGLAATWKCKPGSVFALFQTVPYAGNQNFAGGQFDVAKDIGSAPEFFRPFPELCTRCAEAGCLYDLVGGCKNDGSRTTRGEWACRREEIIKSRYVVQRIRVPDQLGHLVRFPSAKSESQARARSCETAGVPAR